MIEQPYTLAEIREKIASHDYNAELMLLHLLLRVAELEAAGREVLAAHAALTTANLNHIFGDSTADPIPCADRMGRAIDALDALIK